MTPRRLIASLGLALTLLGCGKVGPPVRTREVPALGSVPSATSAPSAPSATSELAGGETENRESEEEPR